MEKPDDDLSRDVVEKMMEQVERLPEMLDKLHITQSIFITFATQTTVTKEDFLTIVGNAFDYARFFLGSYKDEE